MVSAALDCAVLLAGVALGFIPDNVSFKRVSLNRVSGCGDYGRIMDGRTRSREEFVEMCNKKGGADFGMHHRPWSAALHPSDASSHYAPHSPVLVTNTIRTHGCIFRRRTSAIRWVGVSQSPRSTTPKFAHDLMMHFCDSPLAKSRTVGRRHLVVAARKRVEPLASYPGPPSGGLKRKILIYELCNLYNTDLTVVGPLVVRRSCNIVKWLFVF